MIFTTTSLKNTAAYDVMEREGIIDYMRTLALTNRQGDPIDAYYRDDV